MGMQRPRLLAIVAVGTVLLGAAAAFTAPDGLTSAVSWPVGMATGCVLWAGRRHAPWALALTFVAVAGTFLAADMGAHGSFAVAAAQTTGAAVVVAVLTSGWRRPAALLTEPDITRYIAACVVGAAAAALVGGAWAWTHGVDLDRFVTGIATQHLTSQLILVPFFLRMHRHPPGAGVYERAAQWAVTLGVAVAIFALDERLPLVFLVLTCLAWGARRLGTWEVLVQVVAVSIVATALTLADHGPFAVAGDRLDWSADGDGVLLEAFLTCAAFVVIPLVLTVGLQLESLRAASVERDRVSRIADSARATAIIQVDVDATITFVNPAAERLLGYRADEMVGQTPRMFHTREEMGRLCAALGVTNGFAGLSAALARPENANVVVEFITGDGRPRTFMMTVSPVRDNDGALTGYVNIAEDVTDRQLEQESLRRAVERLEAVDQAKEVFVSSVSHELRTPLASIIGYLELLQDGDYGELGAHQAGAVQRISENSERLLSLIDDLLLFSRLGDDAAWIEQTDLELGEVVATACDLVSPTWRARSLDVDVRVPLEPVCVSGDRRLLERLVVNLVGNAVKFTPDGGAVTVSVHREDGWARLDVTDTGVGIAPDDLPRLFTRFFRSRRSQDQAVPGTGLGLSIARSVAEAHGGRIEAFSTEGVGTTMLTVLPLRAG